MISIMLGALALLFYVRGEFPKWRLGGSTTASGQLLSPENIAKLYLRKGDEIVFEGDSHLLGARSSSRTERLEKSFPRLLGNALAPEVHIIVHGMGGYTAEMGLRKWRNAPKGDLLVILYGSNDAAPRGILSRKRPVPLDRFRYALRSIIRAQSAAGGRILVLAPPLAGAGAMNKRLAPYRRSAREIAVAEGVAFLDPAVALASCHGQIVLEYDGTHINEVGQICVAEWLKNQLLPLQRP